MKERIVDFTIDPGLKKTHTTVLNSGDADSKREEIRQYFHASYSLDEALYETLKYHETFYKRADPLRHPLIFYFGHTAVFYINKLIIAKLIDRRLNPSFESMFAVGVDEMSWDDLDMTHYDWPEVDAVKTYRDAVREHVDSLIRTMPLTMPITWDSPFWAIMMGIEHSRIHLETSSVLIRQLPIDEVRRHPLWEMCTISGPAPENEMAGVPGGTVQLGKAKDHPLYGWDNEFGTCKADVQSFAASRYLVSNQEYLQFVEDGGYGEQRWWTEEGWAWRNYRQSQHPLFWIPDGSRYRFRHVLQEIEMPWNWPVEVNQLEAKAYCNWMAARTGRPIRLPTEDEWYLLRDRHVQEDQPYWDSAPGNINLEHYASSCPVDQFAFGEFYDVIGNVWQWTETPISGFSGFDVHPYYDDFSTPTFDTKHNLMKGGSWISTGNEATRDSRYAFRRHFQQHAGFRPVESDAPVSIVRNLYETDAVLCQYCELHYGDNYFGTANYPSVLAERCISLTEGRRRGKALDLGCAVGRASFELARAYDQVTGLDFSANFIRLGVEMQERGRILYTRQDEGELTTYVERTLEEIGLADVTGRVTFQQADPCNLKEIYTGYDLVLAANVIDRLYSPRKFLDSIHTRINKGGLLVLTSPYDWLQKYTERSEWLGGFRKDGEPYTTFEALREILSGHFVMVGLPEDIPFVIRETRRKYQHILSQMTVWRRK